MPYHSHSANPAIGITYMPPEMSSVARCRHTLIACGMNAEVVQIAAINPSQSMRVCIGCFLKMH